MKLYILGKDKKDKGNQLENLTKKILAEQGYMNITRSVIGRGGHEIDVYAVREQQTGIKTIKYPIICECKAHEKMVSMPDYDKFKGKVATAKEDNKNTIGCLIALSGAMGTVIGANESSQDDIQLIANDDIIKLVSQLYSLEDTYFVKKRIKNITRRNIINIDLVYYNEDVFWLISFSSGDYFLIKNDYEALDEKSLSVLQPLLSKVAPVSGYIDIYQEQKAINRQAYITSTILMLAMSKQTSIKEILEMVNSSSYMQVFPTTEKEIRNIANEIPYIKISEQNTYTMLPDDEINFIDLYKYILRGSINIKIFLQDFYKNHINRQLLEDILVIQHRIKIPEDKIDDILFLLSHSPSALAYAITEDESITISRGKEGQCVADNLDKGHGLIFMDKIMDYFDYDYCHNQALGKYYLDDLKIGNIIKRKEVTICCNDNEQHTISQEQTIMLCKLDGYGNTVAPVYKLPEV